MRSMLGRSPQERSMSRSIEWCSLAYWQARLRSSSNGRYCRWKCHNLLMASSWMLLAKERAVACIQPCSYRLTLPISCGNKAPQLLTARGWSRNGPQPQMQQELLDTTSRCSKESFQLMQPRRTHIPGERGMGISIYKRRAWLHHAVFPRDMWITPGEWWTIVRRGWHCPRRRGL